MSLHLTGGLPRQAGNFEIRKVSRLFRSARITEELVAGEEGKETVDHFKGGKLDRWLRAQDGMIKRLRFFIGKSGTVIRHRPTTPNMR